MKPNFNLIKRTKYLQQIRPFYESNYIKVITGIRRCGKSEILKQIMEEIWLNCKDKDQIIFIDLENVNYLGINKPKQIISILNKKIKNDKKYYIFIDEIQRVKKFEELIAAIRNSYNCSLFVTGSNSKLLQGKLQDRLTGRAKEFTIRPFTYQETLEFKQINNIQIKTNDLYEYIKWGGMPQRFEESNQSSINDYLFKLFDSIIKKDVFTSHKKMNKQRFLDISKYIISTSGKTFSALSIAKQLKNIIKIKKAKSLSKSINEYANYLKECYFIDECFPYNFATKKNINGTRKFYCIDSGISTTMGNTIDYDKTFGLESIIYNELKYRGYKVYYGKNKSKEIDFVAIKDNKKCYIQVALLLSKEETFEREYGAFRGLKVNCPKYVISMDQKQENYEGIIHINIKDFLTHKEDISLS